MVAKPRRDAFDDLPEALKQAPRVRQRARNDTRVPRSGDARVRGCVAARYERAGGYPAREVEKIRKEARLGAELIGDEGGLERRGARAGAAHDACELLDEEAAPRLRAAHGGDEDQQRGEDDGEYDPRALPLPNGSAARVVEADEERERAGDGDDEGGREAEEHKQRRLAECARVQSEEEYVVDARGVPRHDVDGEAEEVHAQQERRAKRWEGAHEV